jgi:hypothetical protein
VVEGDRGLQSVPPGSGGPSGPSLSVALSGAGCRALRGFSLLVNLLKSEAGILEDSVQEVGGS